jgi:hypothetical protein
MDGYVLIFGAIFLASLAVPGGLYLLRRGFLRRGRAVRHVSSTTFSLFASLYAFFLGFCLVTLWNDFGTARTVAANEASALLAASYFSRQFNDSGGFRTALAAYAQSVVAEEWPDMDAKLAMNPHTHQLAIQVWDAYRVLAPQDKQDNILYANLGNVLLEASRERNARALLLSGNIYPPVWVIIVFGFFGSALALLCANPDQEGWQLVMEFVVVFTVLSCIYFIYDISTPFSGVLNVPPDAFVNVLVRLGESQAAQTSAAPF